MSCTNFVYNEPLWRKIINFNLSQALLKLDRYEAKLNSNDTF